MPWKYAIASHSLYGADGALAGTDLYSGDPQHKNQASAEGLRGQGPIVEGSYVFLTPRDTAQHGPFVLPLLPDAETRIRILNLGRDPDTFLCHGDSIPLPGTASHGCLIAPRRRRELIWASGDHVLQVVA